MIDLYDFENGILKVDCRVLSYDLNIRPNITVISGESGTGKSLLANYLEGLKYANVYNKCLDINVNVLSYTYEFLKDEVIRRPSTLVVIDRADLILNEEDIEFIRCDDNHHYLIFARTCHNFGISPNYFGDFVITGNRVTINYHFSEPCWF